MRKHYFHRVQIFNFPVSFHASLNFGFSILAGTRGFQFPFHSSSSVSPTQNISISIIAFPYTRPFACPAKFAGFRHTSITINNNFMSTTCGPQTSQLRRLRLSTTCESQTGKGLKKLCTEPTTRSILVSGILANSNLPKGIRLAIFKLKDFSRHLKKMPSRISFISNQHNPIALFLLHNFTNLFIFLHFYL